MSEKTISKEKLIILFKDTIEENRVGLFVFLERLQSNLLGQGTDLAALRKILLQSSVILRKNEEFESVSAAELEGLEASIVAPCEISYTFVANYDAQGYVIAQFLAAVAQYVLDDDQSRKSLVSGDHQHIIEGLIENTWQLVEYLTDRSGNYDTKKVKVILRAGDGVEPNRYFQNILLAHSLHTSNQAHLPVAKINTSQLYVDEENGHNKENKYRDIYYCKDDVEIAESTLHRFSRYADSARFAKYKTLERISDRIGINLTRNLIFIDYPIHWLETEHEFRPLSTLVSEIHNVERINGKWQGPFLNYIMCKDPRLLSPKIDLQRVNHLLPYIPQCPKCGSVASWDPSRKVAGDNKGVPPIISGKLRFPGTSFGGLSMKCFSGPTKLYMNLLYGETDELRSNFLDGLETHPNNNDYLWNVSNDDLADYKYANLPGRTTFMVEFSVTPIDLHIYEERDLLVGERFLKSAQTMHYAYNNNLLGVSQKMRSATPLVFAAKNTIGKPDYTFEVREAKNGNLIGIRSINDSSVLTTLSSMDIEEALRYMLQFIYHPNSLGNPNRDLVNEAIGKGAYIP